MNAIYLKIKNHTHLSHILFFILIILGFFYRIQMQNFLEKTTSLFVQNFDWFILLSVSFFLGLCLYLAFGQYGSLRLGDDNQKPSYSTFSWIGMLFAAGTGNGLIFHGVSEPLFHKHYFNSQLVAETGNNYLFDGTARLAMRMTMTHWGLHAWSIYAIFALIIAYFGFRHKCPFLPSSPFVFKYNLKQNSIIAHIINFMAIIAITFGITGALVQGIEQVTTGIISLGGTHHSKEALHNIIMVIFFILYTLSALLGVSRGVKILSNINVILAVVFLALVIILSPSKDIFRNFATTIGDYINYLPSDNLNMFAYEKMTQWLQDWSIITYLWWIAWSPFVGVFVAKISQGRTIKEFIICVLLVPTLFSIFWFCVLANTGFYLDNQLGGLITSDIMQNFSAGIFSVLNHLPLKNMMIILTLILISIFIITSADSGVFVLAMFSSDGELEPSAIQKIFWGIVLFLMTFSVIKSNGNIQFVRALACAGAIPFLFIILFKIYILMSTLRNENLSTALKKSL
jgi:glycine betaine transporter